MPYETPHGKAFQPGESLEVTQEWLEARRHWHFLEVVQPATEPVVPVEPVVELATELATEPATEPVVPVEPVAAEAPEAVVATKRKRRAKTTEAE